MVSEESNDQGLWKKKGFWRAEVIVAQGGPHFKQEEKKGGSNYNSTGWAWSQTRREDRH